MAIPLPYHAVDGNSVFIRLTLWELNSNQKPSSVIVCIAGYADGVRSPSTDGVCGAGCSAACGYQKVFRNRQVAYPVLTAHACASFWRYWMDIMAFLRDQIRRAIPNRFRTVQELAIRAGESAESQ